MIEFFSSLFSGLDTWHPIFFLFGFSVGLGVEMDKKRNNSGNNNRENNFPGSVPKPTGEIKNPGE